MLRSVCLSILALVCVVAIGSAATPLCPSCVANMTVAPGSYSTIDQAVLPTAPSFLQTTIFWDPGTVLTGSDLQPGTYNGWCIDDPDSFLQGSQWPVHPVSSYSSSAQTYAATYPANALNKVNYLINHKVL